VEALMTEGWWRVRQAQVSGAKASTAMLAQAIAADPRMARAGQPGYPCDVQVIFPATEEDIRVAGPEFRGEILWVTVVAALDTEDTWVGQILNNPRVIAYRSGEYVIFECRHDGLYCVGKPATTQPRPSPDPQEPVIASRVTSLRCPMGRRLVPCRNPSCGNTPLNIEVGQARALLEYNLRNNPAALFTLSCDRCGLQSAYNYSDILALIDPQHRPEPLPASRQWAILLYELTTADTMDYRGFFGERILVEPVGRVPDAWRGILLGASQFAPSLAAGAHVGGPVVSTFLVCEWWDSGRVKTAIPVTGVPKGSVFSIFYGNKRGQLVELQTANLFCSNPSCQYVFSPTYSRVKDMLAEASEKPLAADSTLTLMFTCELCGTSRVVDEASFDGLFLV
jgi:hypothetical protein